MEGPEAEVGMERKEQQRRAGGEVLMGLARDTARSLRFGWRLSAADEEELVAELAARAVTKLGDERLYALARGAQVPMTRAWLATTARRLLLDEWRRKAREEVAEAPDAGAADLPFAARVFDTSLRDAMRGLTPHEGRVVWLRVVEDLEHCRIGALLGSSEGACREAFRAARAKLETALDVSREEQADPGRA